jgi:hypothetical protein
MKRLVMLGLLLTLSAPGSAQLQVQTPATAPACTLTDTITPVIGIAVQNYFKGDTYLDYTGAVVSALKTAGFQVHTDYEYPLPDLASIVIKGEVSQWKNYAGNKSTRVGNVNLEVKDLASGRVVLTLKQQQAFFVFQAPRAEEFAQQVTQAISARFCQLP